MRHRRFVTIPALFVGAPLITGLLPVLVPLACIADLLRLRIRLPLVRVLLFSVFYAWLTSISMVAAGALWLRRPFRIRSERSQASHRRLQRWWVVQLTAAASLLLGLRVEVEGQPALSSGPVIVLSRHTSMIDALVSFVVVGIRGGLDARYVLMRELSWEPALDIVGHRLPNHFVERGGGNTPAQVDSIGRLAEGLGPRDAVVIFPEGTFPTAKRRARALEHLGKNAALLSTAQQFETLLPPRRRGVRRLLDTATDADVVLLGHVGFDEMSSIPGILRSMPFRLPVKVRLWRIPAAAVPNDPAERDVWLFDRWLELDGWTTAELAARADSLRREKPRKLLR